MKKCIGLDYARKELVSYRAVHPVDGLLKRTSDLEFSLAIAHETFETAVQWNVFNGDPRMI